MLRFRHRAQFKYGYSIIDGFDTINIINGWGAELIPVTDSVVYALLSLNDFSVLSAHATKFINSTNATDGKNGILGIAELLYCCSISWSIKLESALLVF